MVNNLRLFDKSRIYSKLNSCVHSSFGFYFSIENQSSKCCWKQAKDGSQEIILLLLETPVLTQTCMLYVFVACIVNVIIVFFPC